jgi:MHS family proline/betaine transporter-like MFS transporter
MRRDVAETDGSAEGPARRAPGQWRLVAATSIGNFLEIYDLLVFGAFAAFMADQFFPRQDPTAALLSTFAILAVGTLARPLGGVVFGHVGDRFGRQVALVSSLLLMSIASVSIALLPTYDSVGLLAPALLLACQLLQNLSAGGETPGSNVFLIEHARPGWRGRVIALNAAASNLAAAAAAASALILANLLTAQQLSEWGWRLAYLVAASGALVGIYLRVRTRDTPAFEALAQADRVTRAPLVLAMRTAKRAMLVFTAWISAVSIGNYLLSVFLPAYLIRVVGLSPTYAFAVNLAVVLTRVVACLVTGYLVDRFPLRRVMIAVMCAVAVGALPGFLILTQSRSLGGALLGQGLWSVFVGAAFMLSGVLGLVLFAVPVRFTATALASNVGISLFGSTAPFVSTWLVAVTASAIAPGFYLLVMATLALAAASFGVPGRRLLSDVDSQWAQPGGRPVERDVTETVASAQPTPQSEHER